MNGLKTEYKDNTKRNESNETKKKSKAGLMKPLKVLRSKGKQKVIKTKIIGSKQSQFILWTCKNF